MDIDEDALRAQIRESIEGDNKKFLLNALLYCYYHDEDGLEGAEDQFGIGRGEAMATSGSFDKLFEQIKYELRTKGRHYTVILILGNLYHYFGTGIRHKTITMVEMCEIDRLVDNDQYMESSLRICSYLDNLLEDQLDDPPSNLYWKINAAGENSVFSPEQEKLAQFIRDTRNDAGHNFWLETEWSYVIHEFAATASIVLLDDLLKSNLGVSKWPVKPRLSLQNTIRVIEDEFGFEWDGDEREWSNDPVAKYRREYNW